MANWWEEGAFGQPDVTVTETDRSAGDAASAESGVDWRSVFVLVAVAALVLVVRGFDMWRGQQLTSESQRNALRQTIAQELAVRRQADEEALLSLLDPVASRPWRQQQVDAMSVLPAPASGDEPPVIERWQFQDEVAMVDLRFSGPPAVRETRFYRLLGDSWRRTTPVESMWGAQREAEAPGIHFVYREADAEAVERAVETLQTTYRQGQLSVLAGDRLTVEIVPDAVVEFDSQMNRLTLPSPRLSPRLASISDSVPILWRLAHPAADRLADPADAARYRYLDTIQLFQEQLRFWPLRWQVPFPERWQVQMLDTLSLAREEDRLIPLRAIDLFTTNRTQAYLAYYEAMTMADYVADEFGTDKLDALAQALAQAPTWDRAISATLGIDGADFERGWRAYLDTHLTPPAEEGAEATPPPEENTEATPTPNL